MAGLGRGFAGLPMDDNVNGFVSEIYVPSARSVMFSGVAGRMRVARSKEDTVPLQFEVRGAFHDTPATGKFWRDFKAAMLNVVAQPFDHGDGTEFRAVDVLDIAHVREGQFSPPNNLEAMAYTAKCLSYEPFARSKSPVLSGGTALNNGNGTFVTNLNITALGTAFSEPTWQFTLVIPVGVTVTQLQIQSTTTGEICTTSGLSLTNGTYIVLIDACGGTDKFTPTNNSYGLLALTSLGYGVTVQGTGDLDFVGTPPTLAEASGVPPVGTVNAIVVSVTATGVLTTATLNYLAPDRWVR